MSGRTERYDAKILRFLTLLGVEKCVEVLAAAGRVRYADKGRVVQVMRAREARARSLGKPARRRARKGRR